MRVILLRDIHDFGKKWEVKDVPNGYARNLLLLRKLAWPATPENLNKRKAGMAADQNSLEQLKKMALKLSETLIVFKLKSDNKGSVFESVKKNNIEKVLAEKGCQIKEVDLKSPLKKLGEHWVKISLGQGVETRIRLRIQPSQDA